MHINILIKSKLYTHCRSHFCSRLFYCYLSLFFFSPKLNCLCVCCFVSSCRRWTEIGQGEVKWRWHLANSWNEQAILGGTAGNHRMVIFLHWPLVSRLNPMKLLNTSEDAVTPPEALLSSLELCVLIE